MKLLTTTGLVLVAVATPVFAQSSLDEVTAQLEAEGFTQIEIELNDGEIEIEGYRAGQEREMVFDATTWELLSDETHADLEADDDNDSDGSEDDDDDHDDHDDDEDESHDDENENDDDDDEDEDDD